MKTKLIVGSRMFGTNTEESDHDYYTVLEPTVVEYFDPFFEERSKQKFDGKKDNRIVTLGAFLKYVASGYTQEVEMLFAPEESVIELSPSFSLLMKHSEMFITKSFVHRLLAPALYCDTHTETEPGRWTLDPKRIANIYRFLHEAESVLNSKTLSFPLPQGVAGFIKELKSMPKSNTEEMMAYAKEFKKIANLLKERLSKSEIDAKLSDKALKLLIDVHTKSMGLKIKWVSS